MKNTEIKKPAKGPSTWMMTLVTVGSALAINAVPEVTLAAGFGDDVFSETLCNIAGWFTSGTGKAIATVAVIFLGIAAFFGKVTWGLALMFALGIFAIFGASSIVEAVGGDNASASCKTT